MRTEVTTTYICENCGYRATNMKDVKKHEKKCTEEKVKAKMLILSFDTMSDNNPFSLKSKNEGVVAKSNLYKMQTEDEWISDYELHSIRSWYTYIPVDDNVESAARMLFTKAQEELTELNIKLEEKVRSFIRDNQ